MRGWSGDLLLRWWFREQTAEVAAGSLSPCHGRAEVEGEEVGEEPEFDSVDAADVEPLVGEDALELAVAVLGVVADAVEAEEVAVAGPLINDALAARFGVSKQTDSTVLTSECPLDVEANPMSVESLAPGALSSPRKNSQFQNLLPDHLIDQEDRSILASDPALAEILHRLRTSPNAAVHAGPLLKALSVLA